MDLEPHEREEELDVPNARLEMLCFRTEVSISAAEKRKVKGVSSRSVCIPLNCRNDAAGEGYEGI